MAAARNHQLDGLRGCAAAAVVVFHAILSTDGALVARVLGPTFQDMGSFRDLAAKLALSVFNGEAAVAIFFVLSGTVLFDSLRRQANPLAFMVRRVFRVFPALWVAVLLGVVALVVVGRPPTPGGLAADLFLLGTSVIGPAWTLQVEMIAVPFILGTFWLTRRLGPGGVVVGFAFAYLVFKLPVLDALRGIKPYLLAFALGFAISTPAGAAVGRRLNAAWCVAALVVILLVRQFVPSPNLTTWMLQIGGAVIVAAIYHGRAGRFGALLERPATRTLGRISYSLYLLNVPILILLPDLHGYDPVLVGLPVGLAVVAATVPLAWMSERWIERPAIRLGNRIAAWRPADGGAAPATVKIGP